MNYHSLLKLIDMIITFIIVCGVVGIATLIHSYLTGKPSYTCNHSYKEIDSGKNGFGANVKKFLCEKCGKIIVK